MFKFFKPKNSFLGIDFGTSAIKVVELSFSEERTHLLNYAEATFNSEKGEMGVRSSEEEIGRYLIEIIKKMETKTNLAYVSIPSFYGLITNIEFPELTREELDQAIKLEAYKYIPSSLDDVYLSWDIIFREKEKKGLAAEIESQSKADSENKKLQVVLVAAPKKEVNKYENVLTLAKMETKTLELDTFSIARALTEGEMETNIIIELGSRTTNIIMTERGSVIISRNLDVGGDEMTKMIASSMNISHERAENLKKQESNFFKEGNASVISHTLDLIVKETERVMGTYSKGGNIKKIDRIILSGGGSKLIGIDKFFADKLGVACSIGNPWKKIEIARDVQPFVKEMGASYTVATGLALKGINDYIRGVR